MAFTTLPGSAATDAASLIGTSGIDIATVASQPTGLFLNAEDANDFITFSKAGSGYTVLGGQGEDSISAEPALTGSIVNGNIGADVIVLTTLDTSAVYGGKQNDTLISATLTSSSVNGNIGADAVTVTSGLSASQVYGGKDNDTLTVGGVISSSSVNGDIGNDTINLNVATLENGSSVQGGLNDDTITLTGVNVFSSDSSVFGGQGNDTINLVNSTAGAVIYGDNDNDTITGGTGADNITVGAGNDRLNYAIGLTGGLAALVDTITDFEVGTNVVDFTDLTNATLRGTGAGYEVVAAGANAVNANTGLVEQNGDLGNLLVATALAAANTMTGWAAGDIVYFLGTNGTDTALYRMSETTGNTTLDSAVLVATFTGVDETTFTAADFADFA